MTAVTTRQEALDILTAPGADYELEDTTINGRACRAFAVGPRTLRELFDQARSELPFFVYEDDQVSFEDNWDTGAALAHALIEDYGISKGDRVAISMRNYPEWVLAFTAVTASGGIAVCMNALWQAEEMEYGLEDSGASVLICDQERLDRFAEIEKDLPVRLIAARTTGTLPGSARHFADVIAPHSGKPMPAVIPTQDDPATILYTSGSTGHPKGVVSCHRNVVSALLSWELDGRAAMMVAGAEPVAPVRQPATLLAVPLFHVTGLHAVLLGSFRSQRRVVSMYKWNAEEAAALIERERVSSFVAPAAMTGDLVQTARHSERDLSSLVSVGGGGAPRAPGQVRDIADSFANAMPGTGWGMTETNAIGTGIGGEEYLKRPESSGRCSRVLELRVVDEDGRELEAGERGELQIRGASVFREYWQRPEANAESFVDGWFRTGDVALLDDEGFLFIVDRIKDIVIRGGENIGCAEVEHALLEHPDVLEASVYAVPDERLGEEVGASLHCRGEPTADELREFLSHHLGSFKIPKYWDFRAEPLPRGATGKILKRAMRDEAAARVTS